jgi:dTDP-4-amino-4,6-dideoxygalactose transaminase
MLPEQVGALLDASNAGRCRVPRDRIKAIVPVHLYGRCANMPELCRIASTHGLKVVEDCAQAHGARIAGRQAGSFGDIAAFSFYPTKNLGAIGDGGAIVTSNASLHEKARLLREYGWRKRYVSDTEGGNSRLDEIQAAILSVKLGRLNADNAARNTLAAIYREQITHPLVVLPARAEPDFHVYHQFAIRCPDRDGLQAHLAANGVGALVHYPCPVHLQPAYADPAYAPLPLVETERWAASVLSLPMFPQLLPEQARRVTQTVNAWAP